MPEIISSSGHLLMEIKFKNIIHPKAHMLNGKSVVSINYVYSFYFYPELLLIAIFSSWFSRSITNCHDSPSSFDTAKLSGVRGPQGVI